MALKFDPQLMPVLLVALITWGGVFFYLLRLERLASALEASEPQVTERDPAA